MTEVKFDTEVIREANAAEQKYFAKMLRSENPEMRCKAAMLKVALPAARSAMIQLIVEGQELPNIMMAVEELAAQIGVLWMRMIEDKIETDHPLCDFAERVHVVMHEVAERVPHRVATLAIDTVDSTIEDYEE